MIGFLEGLLVTLKTTIRRPVTAQYPIPGKRLAVADKFMGFPALTWDQEVGEPYCTGCMVCIRDCPTQCMTAVMKDNPLHVGGKSRRRKIIDEFEINLGRCILCGICVDVCNFDAIEMSHEHERGKYERNGNRVDLEQLLVMGTQFQSDTGWQPTQPKKNSGVPVKKDGDSDDKKPVPADATRSAIVDQADSGGEASASTGSEDAKETSGSAASIADEATE